MVKLLLERGVEIRDDVSPGGSSDGDKFHEGDVVDVRYQGGEEYCPAKISRAHGDETYDVVFDYLDNETGVAARLIRKLLLSPLAIAKENGHSAVVALLEESSRG